MFKTEAECPDCIVRHVDPGERDDDVNIVVKRCSLHMDSGTAENAEEI